MTRPAGAALWLYGLDGCLDLRLSRRTGRSVGRLERDRATMPGSGSSDRLRPSAAAAAVATAELELVAAAGVAPASGAGRGL